eukprot:TRINITY_DN8544_c1_g3_i1.p1 TRINITY_DN8544_c1_g3~~TRINITY_DN8544_c1_g3_i1.p1  ORF type:complete len:200 (+),score=31.28 TRINITY_DN8544_c1_g3_i1:67-666(+)
MQSFTMANEELLHERASMYSDNGYWYGANASEVHANDPRWNAGSQWYYAMDEFSWGSKYPKKKLPNIIDPAEILAERTYCTVKKHARLGCAIVHFESAVLQAAVLEFFQIGGSEEVPWTLGTHAVTVRQHFDDRKNEVDRTGIFVYWGHKVEKFAPLPIAVVADHFNLLAREVKVSLEIGLQPPRADQVPHSCLCDTWL